MFESFFPKPRLFLITLIVWVLVVISFYYLFGKSFAGYLGFDLAKDNETVIGLSYFITPDFIWFYIYWSSFAVGLSGRMLRKQHRLPD